MFLRLAKGLGMDNDLVLAIHGGDPVVSLDHPVRGLHLGRFVIRLLPVVFPVGGEDMLCVHFFCTRSPCSAGFTAASSLDWPSAPLVEHLLFDLVLPLTRARI